MNMHISRQVSADCKNIMDSYGEICVNCNACGRLDPNTKLESELAMLERQLEEGVKGAWMPLALTDRQKKYRDENIAYYEARIAKLKQAIKEG